MKNNTVTAYNGAEIYTDRIPEPADDFIEREPDEKRREDIYNNKPEPIVDEIHTMSNTMVQFVQLVQEVKHTNGTV